MDRRSYVAGGGVQFCETEGEVQNPTSAVRLSHCPLLFCQPSIPLLNLERGDEFTQEINGKAGLELGFRLQTGRRKLRSLGLIIENEPSTPAIVLLHRRLEASPNIVGLHPEGDAGAKLVIHAAARHEPQAGIGANS